jgi:hypothetical protein
VESAAGDHGKRTAPDEGLHLTLSGYAFGLIQRRRRLLFRSHPSSGANHLAIKGCEYRCQLDRASNFFRPYRCNAPRTKKVSVWIRKKG